jgi:predicted  nucleic acid-binding Zn-ribbon protein
MAKNTRKYPNRDEEDLNETIRKLKAQLRYLKKEIKELASENKTLKDAWQKTEDFLSELTQDVPLEELLRYRKLPME